MQTNAKLTDFLKAQAEEFCAEFVRDRAAALRARGAVASGDLARSLQYEVRAQAVDAGVQALIAFEESGRFIDMKNLQPAEGGVEYIQNIISWIQRKGLEEKMITGYTKKRNLERLPERVLTYIAFGIARKRFNGKYKRTRWYNKTYPAKITELYDTILANLPDMIAEEMKQGFDPRNSSVPGAGATRSGSGRTRVFDYAKAKGR